QQKSFSNQLQLLTKTLYKYEDKNNNYLLDFDCFKQLIKTEEYQLIRFLNEITNALLNIFHYFNIVDFYNIHELCQPNNITLLSANHLAISISNEYLFFNPENIEPTRIIINLISKYNECFDKSYNKYKIEWISQNTFQSNSQNHKDLLTLHIYDNAIKEHKEERSMK
ncbi:8154_t:CDS:2, partial [Scutellospora calospora]